MLRPVCNKKGYKPRGEECSLYELSVSLCNSYFAAGA